MLNRSAVAPFVIGVCVGMAWLAWAFSVFNRNVAEIHRKQLKACFEQGLQQGRLQKSLEIAILLDDKVSIGKLNNEIKKGCINE